VFLENSTSSSSFLLFCSATAKSYHGAAEARGIGPRRIQLRGFLISLLRLLSSPPPGCRRSSRGSLSYASTTQGPLRSQLILLSRAFLYRTHWYLLRPTVHGIRGGVLKSFSDNFPTTAGAKCHLFQRSVDNLTFQKLARRALAHFQHTNLRARVYGVGKLSENLFRRRGAV
jgi:hypothetical protein